MSVLLDRYRKVSQRRQEKPPGVAYLTNAEATWLAGHVFQARDSLVAMHTEDTLKVLFTLAADAYRQGQGAPKERT